MEQITEILSGSLTELTKVGLVLLIGLLFTQARKFKKMLETLVGAAEYEKAKSTAIEIAGIIEKKYNTGDFIGNKIEEFEKMILEKIPGLAKGTIDYLREAAVIEIDKQMGKNAFKEIEEA